jgi:meso-butanediol dehydrogenase/(S,S)-butanediol dehydrogenase/diacetyl reductase
VIGLTRLAALQLAPHNINVNSVCPGVTRTALSDANLRSRAEALGISLADMEQRRADAIPLQRANDPEDIAAMVVFLSSPGARNITGQSINVDGGLIFD